MRKRPNILFIINHNITTPKDRFCPGHYEEIIGKYDVVPYFKKLRNLVKVERRSSVNRFETARQNKLF